MLEDIYNSQKYQNQLQLRDKLTATQFSAISESGLYRWLLSCITRIIKCLLTKQLLKLRYAIYAYPKYLGQPEDIKRFLYCHGN